MANELLRAIDEDVDLMQPYYEEPVRYPVSARILSKP